MSGEAPSEPDVLWQLACRSGCIYRKEDDEGNNILLLADEKLWWDLLERVANPSGDRSGCVGLLKLRRYPALLMLYAGGIAAVAGEHHGTLLSLLTKPKLANEQGGSDDCPIRLLSPHSVVDKDLFNQAFEQQWYAPISEHFFILLRDPFRELLHDDRLYQRCFDRFEYLRSLLEVDLTGGVRSVGSYGWRWQRPTEDIRPEMEAEEEAVGPNWPPYQVGWFSRKRERFKAAKAEVDKMLAGLAWH